MVRKLSPALRRLKECPGFQPGIFVYSRRTSLLAADAENKNGSERSDLKQALKSLYLRACFCSKFSTIGCRR